MKRKYNAYWILSIILLSLSSFNVILINKIQQGSKGINQKIEELDELEYRISQLTSEIEDIRERINSEPSIYGRSPIVIRIDDIQDYAFRNAQLLLLEYNLAIGLPMSLSVIPDMFGEDREVVNVVLDAIEHGAEVAAHGWRHENLAYLDFETQVENLRLAKEKLRQVLGVCVEVLTPPEYAFNNETFLAMELTGYSIITTHTDLQQPGLASEVVMSIPATVEFSDYKNDTWIPKTAQALLFEVSRSIKINGYAVIVIHPQELILENEVDLENYAYLLFTLQQYYNFSLLRDISSNFGDI